MALLRDVDEWGECGRIREISRFVGNVGGVMNVGELRKKQAFPRPRITAQHGDFTSKQVEFRDEFICLRLSGRSNGAAGE
tara:strand:+ start:290 stop:529 length:240 start_codon:yes stop_codon:yes gene_type:complete